MACRVLVIEDEETVAEPIRLVLERAGYEVDVLRDGAAGWQALLSGRFRVGIVDLVLPGMSGQEIIRRLEERGPCGTAVVVITGLVSIDDFMIELHSRHEVLHKPFRPERLLEAVRAAESRAARFTRLHQEPGGEGDGQQDGS